MHLAWFFSPLSQHRARNAAGTSGLTKGAGMKIGIPKEIAESEKRVAGTPDTIQKLIKMGFEVQIEAGAGEGASYLDAAYEEAGATIVSAQDIWSSSDLILKLNEPTSDEVSHMRDGAHLISFLYPTDNAELIEQLKAKKVTCIAMDCIPRISRAQKMDALSSMGNVAGYRAVIEAASAFGSFFTGQITAAGRVPPAKVLVIGAGVAGLQALATARGLGAIVRAFDVRAAAREQVESLGGEFLEVSLEESGEGEGGYAKVMSDEFIKAEMDLFYEQAQEVDIVITTALIPGRPAPKLWEKRAVEAMKPGSVIVDLAAPRGGNCELCKPGEVYVHNGVSIIGYTDLPSRLATVCSQLYGTNLCHLLSDMTKDGEYGINLDDEVVRGSIILHEGEMMWPPPKPEAAPAPPPAEEKPSEAAPEPVAAPVEDIEQAAAETASPPLFSPMTMVISALLLGIWGWLRFSDLGMGNSSSEFLQHLTVFVLAVFVGWQVIWSVTAALHTPLMSVTNAISGIIIVGGLLQANTQTGQVALYLGLAAVFFATINIAGGFLVTKRMLKMFRK